MNGGSPSQAPEVAPRQAPPLVLVIFGASGDLTTRKILPALADLADGGRLGEHVAVVGSARTNWDNEKFKQVALEAPPRAGDAWTKFVDRFRYVSGDYGSKDTFDRLTACMEDLDAQYGTCGNRIYYLATVPSVFGEVAAGLAEHHCTRPPEGDNRFVRLVVEKPYGRDVESAIELDGIVHRGFDEDQVFRIDHYMGKETVQNVLALRFANAVFEPIWNRRYVHQIQITVAEQLGVEHRGGFYETAGALRDIVQNHVMQVLALTLMEPPTRMDAEHIRDEKVKLLNAVEIPTPDEAVDRSVRGQYGAGVIDAEPVPAYREEEGVAPDSRTETYIALRLGVDNWRWAGVPIHVRTGKRLPARVTEVVLQFHRVPYLAFEGTLSRDLQPNALVLRIQPDEGISLKFGAKVPGEAFQVRSVAMHFRYDSSFHEPHLADGYPRLLFDAMNGDATLFIRSDEVRQAWRIVDPYLKAWSGPDPGLHPYPAGTWGPHMADLLLARSGSAWRVPVT